MSTTSDAPPPHILVFPYPEQGHMLALLDLTHQLSLRGLTITVLVTPNNLPILSPLLSAHPSIATLVLPFPSHPKLPPGVENVKDIGNSGNFPIISALSRLRDPLLHWFESHPSPPAAIISDFFLGWTLELATQLGIPRIAFYGTSACLSSVVHHCMLNTDTGRNSSVVEFPDLPGSPSFKAEHLPSLFRVYRESDPDSEIVRNAILANFESWGLVSNTFDALEGEYLDYLKRVAGHNRVFWIGPLNLMGIDDVANRGTSGPGSGTNVLSWLDRCPEDSVLYVCFGSQKLLRNEQMEALASGLERSGTRFVWVVKASAKEGYGVVPDGFDERVAGRGMVVRGWAPQVPILEHRAVGGFLSHCGWNSVNEGIVGGVMMLCWPMEADQFVNARLLVEDMGAAVLVCEGADTVPDPDKLGKTIVESLGGNTTPKAKAKELKDKALTAVKSGGSSSCGLEELVKQLKQLQVDVKYGEAT